LRADHEYGDQEMAQLRQRRLSQPFIWHQDLSGDLIGDTKNKDGLSKENLLDSSIPKEMENVTISKVSTCRNSVQGKSLIADDKGKDLTLRLKEFCREMFCL